MSRSRRVSRPRRGCGPRYCWCCDQKACDQYEHDRNGKQDLRDGVAEAQERA